MFELSEVKEDRRRPSFWLKIVVAVGLMLVIINAFRVNPPESRMTNIPEIIEDTKGVIVQDLVSVPAGGFVPFRMSFPYASTLKGSFRTNVRGTRISALVLDRTNMEKFRVGNKFTAYVSTGRVPSGVISRKLDAGEYFLLFENREGTNNVVIDAVFAVE